jgi:hypothetical protein
MKSKEARTHLLLPSESGQSLALMLVMLVALMGMVGLSVDGGRLYAERRQAQNAADNAALAGAWAICAGATDAEPAALAAAATHQFNNDGVTNTVTVQYPPASGAYAGNGEYVQVSISTGFSASFVQLVYEDDLQLGAAATARCRGKYDFAVLALDESTEVRGLQITGNGDLIVTGGGVMANSHHPTQALYESGNGVLTAEPINVSGGVTGDGFSPAAPITGAAPVPDPLAADLNPPPKPPGTCTTIDVNGNSNYTLDPGLYCEISASSNTNIFLNPGVYYIEGPGGLSVTGNANIDGDGVVIYLDETATGVTMSGNSDIDITSPTSGPYAGLLLYMDPANSNSISITGNGAWNGSGTMYAPGATMDLSGNAGVSNFNSMLIAKTIILGGNSDVIINYDAGQNFRPTRAVSLVH